MLLQPERMSLAELAAYLVTRDDLNPAEEEALLADERLGAKGLLETFRRRRERLRREELRLRSMLVEEKQLWDQGYTAVAGVDEAGRGPLAGPLVAAAVVFTPGTLLEGLNDSKQLGRVAREKLFGRIVLEAQNYALGSVSCQEIDRINVHNAGLLAMKRALEGLGPSGYEFVLVDGFRVPDCPTGQKAIKGGDALSLSIAAASILAKVSRDRIMLDLHHLYPCYGFDRHMGYGTAEHRAALTRYGPCPVHRRSFRLDY